MKTGAPNLLAAGSLMTPLFRPGSERFKFLSEVLNHVRDPYRLACLLAASRDVEIMSWVVSVCEQDLQKQGLILSPEAIAHKLREQFQVACHRYLKPLGAHDLPPAPAPQPLDREHRRWVVAIRYFVEGRTIESAAEFVGGWNRSTIRNDIEWLRPRIISAWVAYFGSANGGEEQGGTENSTEPLALSPNT